ncbi:MAG: ABC transporter ATP-binding protein [Vicinamibacteria bacterium]|nr:ABC transporter ATP-binding protein [Vicinamibacteria bacterium]
MIEIQDVSKSYRTRRGPRFVLNRVNLRVARGQHLGVVGRNGAGKSTLVRLISGAEQPTSGRVVRRGSVSWPLAFGGAFHRHLTGLDNLRFICRIYGVSYANALAFVEDFTELGSYLREPVMHYSSGMSARLAFALSMAIEFDCFLIDEIVAVGDSRFHEKCRIELFEKRKDRTLILVSHDPNVIKSHCDSAVVLEEGRVIPFDSVDDAYAHYLVQA